MTQDLDDPQQVEDFVRRFYAQVDRDDLLGPVFNEVAQVDWPEHLAKLTAFWSRALFSASGYQGNPFRAHFLVHSREPFTLGQFEQWLFLFQQTLDREWKGPKADQASKLAHNVAQVHAHQLLGKQVSPDDRIGDQRSG